jgi:hypothetical protein
VTPSTTANPPNKPESVPGMPQRRSVTFATRVTPSSANLPQPAC